MVLDQISPFSLFSCFQIIRIRMHRHYWSHTIAAVLACLMLGVGDVQSAEREPQRSSQRSSAVLTNLRCEYLKNPMGLDIPHPRLSWNI